MQPHLLSCVLQHSPHSMPYVLLAQLQHATHTEIYEETQPGRFVLGDADSVTAQLQFLLYRTSVLYKGTVQERNECIIKWMKIKNKEVIEKPVLLCRSLFFPYILHPFIFKIHFYKRLLISLQISRGSHEPKSKMCLITLLNW